MLKLSQRVYGIALVCILAIFAAVYRFAAWESASKEVSGFIDGSWFVALCLVVITVKAVRMIYKLFTQKFKFWYLIKTLFLSGLVFLIWVTGFDFSVNTAVETFSEWKLGGDFSVLYLLTPCIQYVFVMTLLGVYTPKNVFIHDLHEKIIKAFAYIAAYGVLITVLHSYGFMEAVTGFITFGVNSLQYALIYMIELVFVALPIVYLAYIGFILYKIEEPVEVEQNKGKDLRKKSLQTEVNDEAEVVEAAEESSSEVKKPFYIRAYTSGLKGAYNFLEKIKPKV